MDNNADLFKALAEPVRLRILNLLRHGELCVCDLMATLGMPQSTVSRHLARLKAAGWAHARRSKVWTYYRLADDDPGRAALLAAILGQIENGARGRADMDALLDFLHNKKTAAACD